MKIKAYLQDKSMHIIMYMLLIILIQFILYMFRVPVSLLSAVILIMVLFLVIIGGYDYSRKISFYNKLLGSIEQLDKKYLVTEIVEQPEFLEGQLIFDVLYEINKAMYEEIEGYRDNVMDYKEYVEMWIHEVKIPIANIVLILHNNKPDAIQKIKPQIRRIEDFVEQVLYYVRSENAEKDYLIRNCNLQDIIHNVVRKNKDSLLLKKIAIKMENVDQSIVSDCKWLEFILNQIISNAIKYAKEKKPCISFIVKEEENITTLYVEDNGAGISESDLPRVFEKSFTGENGRSSVNSTGMGLYLANKLCTKLGHVITIDSKKNSFTSVSISFKKDKYYNDVR